MDGNGFTNKEILIEIRDNVKELAAKIDRIDREGSIGTQSDLQDHENRLRLLERFRYAIPSVATLALFASIAATVIAALHF